MIERSVMSPSDVNATYSGTVLGATKEGVDLIIPILIREALSSNGEDCDLVIAQDLLHDKSLEFNLFGDEYEMIWEWPALGYVNMSRYCVYHRRMAQRQWKRGVRNRQVHQTIVSEREAMLLGHRLRLDFYDRKHIVQLFNREYRTVEDSLNRVLGKKSFSQAFSPTFAVAVKEGIKAPALIYKGHCVGYFKDGEPILVDSMSHLEPELERSLCE